MTIKDVDEQFECIKQQGENGEKICTKLCIRFTTFNKEFIKCKFFRIKEGHAIFKMWY